jgi:hypothetical protein
MNHPSRERRQTHYAVTVIEIASQRYATCLADGIELLGAPSGGDDS